MRRRTEDDKIIKNACDLDEMLRDLDKSLRAMGTIKNVRDFGKVLQEEAYSIACWLERCGADARRYLWITATERREDGETIEIPADLADILHAIALSLIPRSRGRPPKESTTAARAFVEYGGRSKRKAARTIARAMKEKPENVRAALRPKSPKPHKPRR